MALLPPFLSATSAPSLRCVSFCVASYIYPLYRNHNHLSHMSCSIYQPALGELTQPPCLCQLNPAHFVIHDIAGVPHVLAKIRDPILFGIDIRSRLDPDLLEPVLGLFISLLALDASLQWMNKTLFPGHSKLWRSLLFYLASTTWYLFKKVRPL